MTESSGTTRHVAIEQLRIMVDFMSQHVDFASGKLRTLEARHQSKALWEELAALLNDCNEGVKKTSDGWSKYWSDWKNKLKNKTKLLKKKGFHELKLSRLEKGVLKILGPGFDKKSKATRNGSASYGNSYTHPLPAIIKLETSQEIANNLSGDERISDDHSEYSHDEDVDDADQNSNEPLIHSLYPKWLIEVEKKRAEAELARGRAEEQRAAAALLQADALKKLAEATSNQADALLRIAMVLEARGERDVLAI